MRTLLRALGALGLLAGAGCVGVMAFSADHRGYSAPRLDPDAVGTRRLSSAPALAPLTADRLREQWGPPDEFEELAPDEERWTYVSDDLSWRGAVLMLVVLPVPLAIPVGHDTTVFVVREGRVASAESDTQRDSTCLVGWIPGPSWRLGVECSGWSDDL